ncbi:MAG TPA: WHG domain-containing protein [Acidimicrobiales bacterium]|nr:WHG domain-containing protein [Acidimicrobiales bacterium]
MPKAGLTHDTVVREAAHVADEVGWENLTLAVVAQRLGVSMPGLYKHIGSIDGLRHDVAVLALSSLAAHISEATRDLTGTEALHALASAYRSFVQRHPGLYAAAMKAPSWIDAEHSAAARSVLQALYGTLEGYSLGGREAADAVRAVRATLHGFSTLEASGGFGAPLDIDRSYGHLIEALDGSLKRWPSSGEPSPGNRGPAPRRGLLLGTSRKQDT